MNKTTTAAEGRSLQIIARVGGIRVIGIRQDGKSSTYVVTPWITDEGQFAAAWAKQTLGGEVHHVHVGEHGPTCDCRGFERHGHCKHASATAALQARGELVPVDF